MKNISLVIVLAIIPVISYSQHSVESTVAIGGTIVDIETLVLIDEGQGTVATDWGTFSGGLSLQYFYETNESVLSVGMEIMYQHLFWYEVHVPYGVSGLYREYSINAFKIAPIIRIGGAGKVALDLGPTIVFRDGVVMGAFISLNYNITLSDKLEIPIKARAEYMNLYEVNVWPITLNAGIRLKL